MRRNSIPLITGMFQSSRTTSGISGFAPCQSFLPIARFIDLERKRFENVASDLADHLRVIDD